MYLRYAILTLLALESSVVNFMKAIIERLTKKINTLVVQYDDLKLKHQESLSTVDALSSELDKSATTIQQLEEKLTS